MQLFNFSLIRTSWKVRCQNSRPWISTHLDLATEGEEGELLSGKYGISINFYTVECQHYCQPINVLKNIDL